MATTKYILIGGGGHARVVLDCMQTLALEVLALFDPKHAGLLFGVPQQGAYDPTFEPDASAIIAIGDNTIRKRIAQEVNRTFASAVHGSALVSQHATVGAGTVILQGALVQAQAQIGNHVIINTGAQTDHDCVVKDFVHLAPGAILCGNVHVGEGTLVGAGATVIPGKKIGAWATIGAGAVVIDDIPDYAVAVGNPARVIKFNRQ